MAEFLTFWNLINQTFKETLATALSKVAGYLFLPQCWYLLLLLPAVFTAAHLASVLVAPLNLPKAAFSPSWSPCTYSGKCPFLPVQGVPFLKYKLWIYSLTFIMSTQRAQEETRRRGAGVCVCILIYGQWCGGLWLTFSFGHFKMINLPVCF